MHWSLHQVRSLRHRGHGKLCWSWAIHMTWTVRLFERIRVDLVILAIASNFEHFISFILVEAIVFTKHLEFGIVRTSLRSSFRWPPCGAEVEKDEDQPKASWGILWSWKVERSGRNDCLNAGPITWFSSFVDSTCMAGNPRKKETPLLSPRKRSNVIKKPELSSKWC